MFDQGIRKREGSAFSRDLNPIDNLRFIIINIISFASNIIRFLAINLVLLRFSWSSAQMLTHFK